MEHCFLFEEIRSYAQAVVRRERDVGSFESFFCLVETYAFNDDYFKHRGIDMNLSVSQVKAVVKSVSRWTWKRSQVDYRRATSPLELGFFEDEDDDCTLSSVPIGVNERRNKRKECIRNKML